MNQEKKTTDQRREALHRFFDVVMSPDSVAGAIIRSYREYNREPEIKPNPMLKFSIYPK